MLNTLWRRDHTALDIFTMCVSVGIDVMDYDARWGHYRLRLTKNDMEKHSDLLLKLLKMSYGLDIDSGSAVLKAKA